MSVRPFFKDDPNKDSPRSNRKPQHKMAPTEGSKTQARKANLAKHKVTHPKH